MINKNEVQHVAKLARLGLSQDEINKMGKELSSILDYFRLLDELDVSKVSAAFYAIPLKSVMREDKIEKKDRKEADELLSQAPQREKRYIRVKEILR